ncbi:hypothetical protein [Streptosporangium saharense]|uniref:hypothetical protein n=1 Tax=Streptosporangium saharense TaxID=1706840 RepID=UPI00368A1BD9
MFFALGALSAVNPPDMISGFADSLSDLLFQTPHQGLRGQETVRLRSRRAGTTLVFRWSDHHKIALPVFPSGFTERNR